MFRLDVSLLGGLAALLLAATAAGALARGPGAGEGPKPLPAPKEVADQDDAVAEARKVDLPLLGRADRVVIEGAARPGQKGRRVTLKKADEIRKLREALKPGPASPSGGTTAATIRFYRGEKPLREIWVYSGGEWGFRRPGTSWTTGRQSSLWEAVQEHLKD